MNAAMLDSHIFSTLLSKLVEDVWEETIVWSSSRGPPGDCEERQSSEGWCREGVYSVRFSRAVLELTGIMRRTVGNTTGTVCQV